jgi:periplasmic protein CpxP/Spy
MKLISKIFATLVVSVLVSLQMTLAQEPAPKERTPEQIAEAQTKKLSKELSLNEEQQKAVYGINLKYAQQNTELRKSMLKAKKAFGSREEELNALLDEDQKQKLAVLRAEQKEKAKQRRMANRGVTEQLE